MFGRTVRRQLVSKSNVKITTLPNQVRVATEDTPGHFTSVGVYVDAGSRYETLATSGVSHFMDRMAFKVRNRTLLLASLIRSRQLQIFQQNR
jgi:processing peptidase subunit alpha